MGRAFQYVILGGGVAAGYAALELTRRGVTPGELCIISEEKVAPYERPALSKRFLLPEAASQDPFFYTCIGINEEILTPKWYKDHGIELVLGTRVKSADLKGKTLLTATGETITYKILIIATGARALKLEEFGIIGLTSENVCYLRDLSDAEKLLNVMQPIVGGHAVVIGGGYIGMECAASLRINKINVTMVFPEEHCMPRLFTNKIADYYEKFYMSKGIKFIKGTPLTSFDVDTDRKVTAVNLKDGTKIPADMVVVGMGIRPNTRLFQGQLSLEKGGIKVNGRMQTSDTSVYAVGDVTAFPIRLYGEIRRLEHADSARKSARHAVAAIMSPKKTGDFDYLPCFYSSVFTLSWQFFGDRAGEAVHFGDYSSKSFGAYWVNEGQLVGSFLEGGTTEEYEALAKVSRLKPEVDKLSDLENQGIGFALELSNNKTPPPPPILHPVECEKPSVGVVSMQKQEIYPWHATAGVLFAVSISGIGYWYGRRRRRW